VFNDRAQAETVAQAVGGSVVHKGVREN